MFVHDTQTAANDVNNDLKIINNWAFQWKINFDPDPTKQAHEVILATKLKKYMILRQYLIILMFLSHHHQNIILDSKLIFDEHLKMISLKIIKTLGLLRKLHNLLPRSAVLTINKTFFGTYLGYSDILYDQAYNMYFHHKLESIQYKSCLAITGAIPGTSKKKKLPRIRLRIPSVTTLEQKMRNVLQNLQKHKSLKSL